MMSYSYYRERRLYLFNFFTSLFSICALKRVHDFTAIPVNQLKIMILNLGARFKLNTNSSNRSKASWTERCRIVLYHKNGLSNELDKRPNYRRIRNVPAFINFSLQCHRFQTYSFQNVKERLTNTLLWNHDVERMLYVQRLRLLPLRVH